MILIALAVALIALHLDQRDKVRGARFLYVAAIIIAVTPRIALPVLP